MDNSIEEKAIREAINYYVEGTRNGDVEMLKKGFHEQAILCGYLGDELIAAPIAGYYEWVAGNPAPAITGDVFECEVLAIEQTGRVATATVREIFHEVVIDYFHLLKIQDKWWIVSKLWDTEPTKR